MEGVDAHDLRTAAFAANAHKRAQKNGLPSLPTTAEIQGFVERPGSNPRSQLHDHGFQKSLKNGHNG
jgi:hypothetical protein